PPHRRRHRRHPRPASFPTRRSSDLKKRGAPTRRSSSGPSPYRGTNSTCASLARAAEVSQRSSSARSSRIVHTHVDEERWETSARSEEHTSELQSRSDVVCRLLLEKK